MCDWEYVPDMDTIIIESECIDSGVLVVFDNGMTALFSAAYLYAHLADAAEFFLDDSGPVLPDLAA